MSQQIDDADLAASQTAGYKITEKKNLSEYAELDKEDEALNRWKASLGIGADAGAAGEGKCEVTSLALVSSSRSAPLVLDLTNPASVAELKKNPVTIKEGSEYAVEITFKISGTIITGLRYVQVVKRAGVKVDKMEHMIGSYGPSADPVVKKFAEDEAPSGMIARSGTYAVRSRITDDDGKVYADVEWSFVLKKEW